MNYELVQRYCEEYFYAFTRGNVLACFVNNNGGNYVISFQDFNNGDKLCDILEDDYCVIVTDNNIYINMVNYPKVFWNFKYDFLS